jgi:predicted dehydrogenase
MTMTEDQKVRIGFVGTGWAERVQIPMFRQAGLTAQAICSASPANARRAAQQLDIPEVYTSWQELVHAETVDLVSIVTPPHLHREITVAALQAGKHVLCEKPTALNVAEAEAMLAAAQAAPNQLAIIDHELRFHPQRVHLQQLVKGGYVGALLRVDAVVHNSSRLNPALPWDWRTDAERGGGMLGAIGSHLLDLCRWIAGKIDSLTATLQIGHYYRNDKETGSRRQVTADDHAHLLLRFTNGAQGSILVSGLTPGASGTELTVLGTNGALRLDQNDQLWGVQGDDLYKGNWQPLESGSPGGLPNGVPADQPFQVGTYCLGRALAEALPRGETVLPEAASFYDGLAVQRALDAARQSQRDPQWVVV